MLKQLSLAVLLSITLSPVARAQGFDLTGMSVPTAGDTGDFGRTSNLTGAGPQGVGGLTTNLTNQQTPVKQYAGTMGLAPVFGYGSGAMQSPGGYVAPQSLTIGLPGGGSIGIGGVPGTGYTGGGCYPGVGVGYPGGGSGVSIGVGGYPGGGSGVGIGVGVYNPGCGLGCTSVGVGVRLGPGGLIGIGGSGNGCGVGGNVSIGGYNLGGFSANGCGLSGNVNAPNGRSYGGTAFGPSNGCGACGFGGCD